MLTQSAKRIVLSHPIKVKTYCSADMQKKCSHASWRGPIAPLPVNHLLGKYLLD
jgi:hypothetical protein